MRVRHYSYSKTGGAGRCADALSSAQGNLGVDADFSFKLNGGLRSLRAVARFPKAVISAAADQYLVKKPQSPSLFSLHRGTTHGMGSLGEAELESNDISHLHWIEGMIPRRQIRSALLGGAKIVWTLHDMAPFTGGCHFSLGCHGFAGDCAGCPQVRAAYQDAVAKNFREKQGLLSGIPGRSLSLVAPSTWLQQAAQQSAMFENFDVAVIPNPIAPEFFQASETRIDPVQPAEDQRFVITLVAEDLSNPLKRVDLLLRLLGQLSEESFNRLTIQLVGHNGSAFLAGSKNVVATGPKSTSELVEIFDRSQLLVSVSSAESAGMTIKEAAARGVTSLVLGAAGAQSTIDNGVTGLVAESETEFVRLLENLIRHRNQLNTLGAAARDEAFKNNQPSIAASRYLKIYEDLLA